MRGGVPRGEQVRERADRRVDHKREGGNDDDAGEDVVGAEVALGTADEQADARLGSADLFGDRRRAQGVCGADADAVEDGRKRSGQEQPVIY